MLDRSGIGKMRDIYGIFNANDHYVPMVEKVKPNHNIEHNNCLMTMNVLDTMATISSKSKFVEIDGNDSGIINSKAYSHEVYVKRNFTISQHNNSSMINGYDEQSIVSESINEDRASLMYQTHKNAHIVNLESQWFESRLYPIHNFDLLEDTSDPDNSDYFYDRLINYHNSAIFPYTSVGPIYMTSPHQIPVLKAIEDRGNIDNSNIPYIDNLELYVDDTKYDGMFRLLEFDNRANNNDCPKNTVDIVITYMIRDHIRKIGPFNCYIPRTIIQAHYKIYHNTINKINNMIRSVANVNGNIYIPNKDDSSLLLCKKPTTSDFQIHSYFDSNVICFLIDAVYHNKNSAYTTASETINSIMSSMIKMNADQRIKFIMNGIVMVWPFGNVFYGSGSPCATITNYSSLPFTLYSIINNNYRVCLTDAMYGFYIDFMESKFNSDLMKMWFIKSKIYTEFLAEKNMIMKKKGYKSEFDYVWNEICTKFDKLVVDRRWK